MAPHKPPDKRNKIQPDISEIQKIAAGLGPDHDVVLSTNDRFHIQNSAAEALDVFLSQWKAQRPENGNVRAFITCQWVQTETKKRSHDAFASSGETIDASFTSRNNKHVMPAAELLGSIGRSFKAFEKEKVIGEIRDKPIAEVHEEVRSRLKRDRQVIPIFSESLLSLETIRESRPTTTIHDRSKRVYPVGVVDAKAVIDALDATDNLGYAAFLPV
ncbi:hypothetical protein SGCOL_003556 [Colletotrichum sp. CLE4]